MANVKVSDLPLAHAVGVNDVFEVVQDGENRKLPASRLKEFIPIPDELVMPNDLPIQCYTAFTATGGPAFALAGPPAITAYAAGLRLRVKFPATAIGASLNVNELGAHDLKQYDAAGAKIPAVLATGQLADVEFDGVDFVLLTPLAQPKGIETYTANGNFTVPPGVTALYLSGCAGGGGGGGSATIASNQAAGPGGGGGAGQWIMRKRYEVASGQVIPITIGAGGNGGAGGAAWGSGTAGGNTVIGALVTLNGGGGGGAGGKAVGATAGGPGGAGYPAGGYGADCGSALGGHGGAGAGTPFGPGTPPVRNAWGGNAVTGANAAGYGSGGSGAGGLVSGLAGTGAAGGNGAPGMVIIEW